MIRAALKKRKESMTSKEKKARRGPRKSGRGETKPGTANPVAVLAAGYRFFVETIRTKPDWGLLVSAAGSPEKRLYGFDIEFASTSTTETEPSEWGHLLLFEACVILVESPSRRVLLNERVNFVPPSYNLGAIEYLKEKLPKNFDRALRSLGRVHNFTNRHSRGRSRARDSSLGLQVDA